MYLLPALWSAVLSTPLLLCFAATQNVTIDDTQTVGDSTTGAHIIYHKPENWACGCIPTCDCSTAHPDKSIAFDQTWHEGSFWEQSDGNILVKVDVLFTGTAVYVYTILSSDWPALDITFMIDGQKVSHYNQNEATGLAFVNGFIPAYPMFSTTGLSSAQHNLTVAVGLNQKPEDLSMFMLDYITYSFDPGTSSSSKFDPDTSTSSAATRSSDPTLPTTASSESVNSTATAPSTSPSNTATTNAASNAAVNPTTSSNAPANSTALSNPPVNPVASTTRSKTPMIVGSVIGATAAISIILLILFLCYSRAKKQRHDSEQPTTTPFDGQVPYQPSTTISASTSEGLSKRVVVSDPKSTPQTRTSSISHEPSGPSEEQQSENQEQPAMVPMEAAMTLAAEVERLRSEIGRLNGRREVQEDTLPPPYLEEERSR